MKKMPEPKKRRDQFTVIVRSDEDLELLRWMDEVVHQRNQGGDKAFNRSVLALELIKRGRKGYEVP